MSGGAARWTWRNNAVPTDEADAGFGGLVSKTTNKNKKGECVESLGNH